MKYIGGEFCLTGNEFFSESHSKQDLSANKVFLDTGRSAIFVALQSVIAKGGARKAWLPSFCCSSVLQPFSQLGFEIQFYSMGVDLQQPEFLPQEMSEGVFLFINYFGKNNNAIKKWIAEQKNMKCFIIEDSVQASLNNNICEYDFLVTSLRKFLPQPDGALLFSRQPITVPLAEPNEKFISQKIIGKWMRNNNWESDDFLALFNKSEELLNNKIVPRKMSWFSEYLMEKTNFDEVIEKRRRNWIFLRDILNKRNRVNALFDNLDQGEVPLGFPVIIRKGLRDILKKRLAEERIYCPIHWRMDHCAEGFAEHYLSSNILTLPIDQRMDQKEVLYLFERVNAILEGAK